MEQIIQDFIKEAIGHPLWNVRLRVGSMLIFETGKEIEKDRGEFHFWVNCAHWWLQQGEGNHFEDVVHSESSKKNMEEKIQILNGKKLLHIQFNSEIYSLVLDFEDNLFLRIGPYGGNEAQAQFYVFKSKEILSVLSNGTVRVEPIVE